MKRRGRKGSDGGADETSEGAVDEGAVDEGAAKGDKGGLSDRNRGPWDASEVSGDDSRLDLGGVRIRGFDGLQMQVQMDEKSGAVTMITLTAGEGILQIQAFAAPRRSGIWADVRKQLASSISGSGGLAEESPGEFGPELRAKVPGPGGSLQPARFVGVDGPRWFLRGLFLGSAAEPGGSSSLEDTFRDLVVVRGDEAMAPGDAIAMKLPEGSQATRVQP